MGPVTPRPPTWRTLSLYLLSVAALLGLWSLAARLLGSSILLPRPTEAWNATLLLFAEPGFWSHIGATLGRAVFAFVLAVSIASALGILAGVFHTVEILLRPWILVVRSTPVISIILLTLVLLRSNAVPAVVALLITLPLMYATVVEGVHAVDPSLEEMSHLYRVPLVRRIRRLYIPSLAPFFLSGLHAALGLTFKVVAAAEVLAQPSYGVGSAMQEARILLSTAEVIAWTLILLFLSALGETIFRLLWKAGGNRDAASLKPGAAGMGKREL